MANLQMNKQELNTDLKQKLKNRQFLGENICKWYNWQGLNFQNIQIAHTTQCQKNKIFNQKMGRTLKQTFLQRRHTDG